MKVKNKILAFALSSMVMFSSCGDFLTEEPTTSMTKEKAYATEASVAAVLEGAYAGAQSTFASSLWAVLTQCSGLTLYRPSGSGLTVDQKQALEMDYRSNTGTIVSSYQSCYTAINRFNNIIDELPKHPEHDPQFVEHILGHAYFMRATLYFHMVRIWGGVPLRTTPAREAADLHPKRASLNDIYKQIVSDLKLAHELMPDKGETRTLWPDKVGYPHKWAPLAMLSKVYLQMGCIKSHPDDPFPDPHFTDENGTEYSAADLYNLALSKAEEVMTSGRYELLPKFADLFYVGRQNTIEGILEMQASLNSGTAPTCAVQSVPNYCTQYANKDNSMAGRVRPSHEVFYKFNDDDPRKKASMIYGSYISYQNENPAPLNIFPTEGGSTGAQGLMPYFRKYFDSLWNATGSNAHFYVMRYADVYLIAAEAANEIGEDGKAEQYLNRIRQRARDKNGNGNPNDAGEIFPDDLSHPGDKAAFRNIIMNERVLEFLGENHEWFDTRRQGWKYLLDNVIIPHNSYRADASYLPVPVAYHTAAVKGYFELVTDEASVKRILILPISINEINANDNISPADQNPGYN